MTGSRPPTPGGCGNKVLPNLSQATLQSCRDVFGAEIPHYFRHLYDKGERSASKVPILLNFVGSWRI